MYSESDLDGAVAAGALSPDAARALRAHVAAVRATPSADDESFRLLTGFNDIFVSIALVLTLGAVAGLAWTVLAPLAAATGLGAGAAFVPAGLGVSVAMAAASWMLAEYFTRVRRMALPSILLLLTFVAGAAGAAGAVAALLLVGDGEGPAARGHAALALAGTGAAAAAWVHWRRFAVPITVAAGAAAAVGVAASLVLSVPGAGRFWQPVTLAGGLALFALAMRWDLSDPERRTRRADVAFWLHLAAAPMIAHPLFGMFGLLGGPGANGGGGAAGALGVLALYLFFALVALAVDRRALLVSGLAYVIAATGTLVEGAGAVDLGWIVTALVIGSALLSLSAFWAPMRRLVVERLGGLGRRLPPVAAPA